MKLNNKGFAITGILYTVFILFLLVIASVLAGLQLRKNMLEKSIMKLEDTYEGVFSEEMIQEVNKINEKTSETYKIAPVTGKYIFNVQNNFFSNIQTTDFSYTGTRTVETYEVEKTGYYKIEVWGADGGGAFAENGDLHIQGGKGGYASGVILINKDETPHLYIYVGEKGKPTEFTKTMDLEGGWNGGGKAAGFTDKSVGSGGGATDVRLEKGENDEVWNNTNSLNSRIIVAGGGGGSSYQSTTYYGYGGVGGGYKGGNGQVFGEIRTVGTGGKDDGAGEGQAESSAGGLGFGAGANSNGTGGGGGYYGGGSGLFFAGGGGGSSYISDRFVNKTTISGNQELPTHPDEDGNGYVRITYYGTTIENLIGIDYIYGHTGKEQEFTAPETGNYRLEVWGAQGGNAKENGKEYTGGKGGYTSGIITLNKDEKLYINVGGRGENMIKGQTAVGGYNGGGSSPVEQNDVSNTPYGAAGGGATHIATSSGELRSLHNRTSSVLIVAGAGGGANLRGENYGEGNGGYGGGADGGAGESVNHTSTEEDRRYGQGTGGTQSSGGYYITYTQDGVATDHKDAEHSGGFGYGTTGQSGGGAGWYGGGNGGHGGAGGGSGHIGTTITDGKTYDGDTSVPSPTTIYYKKGNIGDGYAKITYLGYGTKKINNITCEAYLTKGTKINSDITFLTQDCNDLKKSTDETDKFKFLFDPTLTNDDYNVMTLSTIYSFER